MAEPVRVLTADAQTSGGLLLTVPPSTSANSSPKLIDAGHTAAEIGVLEAYEVGARIVVAR